MTVTAVSRYRTLTVPDGTWTETLTADYRDGEAGAWTLTRAVAAHLSQRVTVRTAHIRSLRGVTARIGFVSLASEPRRVELRWCGTRFGIALEETGIDLHGLDLFDLTPTLAQLADTPAGQPLAAAEHHQVAQRLTTHLLAMTSTDRIRFAAHDCAGCARRTVYRVRHRDSLCPRCRGEQPHYPDPVRTLCQARRHVGLVEFLHACAPATYRQLAHADRYLQLDLFRDLGTGGQP